MKPLTTILAVMAPLLFAMLLLCPLDLPQPTPAKVNGFLQQSERIWSE